MDECVQSVVGPWDVVRESRKLDTAKNREVPRPQSPRIHFTHTSPDPIHHRDS